MHIDAELLKQVEMATEQWKDSRIICKDDLRDLILFHSYGQKVFSQLGLGLQGWVCRQRNGTSLLTVKVIDSGTPLVAFITSATPTGCVSKLFNLVEKDAVNYAKDKYPWI